MRFTPEETRSYIRDQATQLATLANEAGLDILAHLLKMTELEASGKNAEIERRHIARAA